MRYSDLAQHLRKLAYECDEHAKGWELEMSGLTLEQAVAYIRERQKNYASLSLDISIHKDGEVKSEWKFLELHGRGVLTAPTLRGVLELAYAAPTLDEAQAALTPPKTEPEDPPY